MKPPNFRGLSNKVHCLVVHMAKALVNTRICFAQDMKKPVDEYGKARPGSMPFSRIVAFV
jgi:hypothetical protein